jgi:hypothetical protein
LALYALLFYGGVTPGQLRELNLSLDFAEEPPPRLHEWARFPTHIYDQQRDD